MPSFMAITSAVLNPEKDHDLPDRLLLRPGRENAGCTDRPDAVDFAKPVRCRLDDIEHFLAEGTHQLLSVDRPNTSDHAGRKIFLDAFRGSWRRCAEKACPELLAVGAVVDPFARCCDPLAGGDDRGMANYGYNVTMPACFGAQNAKPIICVVIGHPLEQSRQHFC